MPDDSMTETYVALRLEVDNWRWAGVPIYLRTGKRLARKVTEIAVTLKPVPHLAFQAQGSVGVQPNQLILTVQPNEGVSLSLGAKIPGMRMRIRPVNMEFLYGTSFLSQSPEAYERLIMDAMRGDATLFTRNDEVEAQWRIIDPILDAWEHDETRRWRSTRPARPAPRRPTGSSPPDTAGGRSRCRGTAPEVPDAGAVWSAENTTPSDIEEALRHLLQQQHARDGAHAPRARAEPRRGGRPRVAGRDHEPARAGGPLPRVAHDPVHGRAGPRHDRRSVVMTVGAEPEGDLHLTRERVVLEVGEKHLAKLDTIVDPLVVTDLPTLVWAPHGHPEAVDALLHMSQVVLIDSVNEPDPRLGARPGEGARAGGLRRRPRLAAHHALARARGLDVRPAPLARRAPADRRGDHPPPARLGAWPACSSSAGSRRGSAGAPGR